MSQDQQQPYDSALKSLMGDEAAEILPRLLPESEYISEQNIEVDRTTVRADLVYNILMSEQEHRTKKDASLRRTLNNQRHCRRIKKYRIAILNRRQEL